LEAQSEQENGGEKSGKPEETSSEEEAQNETGGPEEEGQQETHRAHEKESQGHEEETPMTRRNPKPKLPTGKFIKCEGVVLTPSGRIKKMKISDRDLKRVGVSNPKKRHEV
jgi:hypothetical protein